MIGEQIVTAIAKLLPSRRPNSFAAKKALWITLGEKGNAGDALIYQATRRAFDGLVDLDFRSVSDPLYLPEGKGTPDNIIIGPGGILVQTNSSKHLHEKLARQWPQLLNSRFHLWSTGVLEKPSDKEAESLKKLLAQTKQVVVRAGREADFLRGVDPLVDPVWSPCASLFSDSLFSIEARKRDVVVLNLDSFLFTEENIRDHPLRRFKEYAESNGLEVRSMTNAAGDSNSLLLDVFPLIEIDEPHFDALLRGNPAGREFHAPFTKALRAHPSIAGRYLDCRFAFGKRLHGWLPFLAFDTPAAFIGMHTRRGMPKEYFGSDTFLCDVPRKQNMSRDQIEQMADMMIGKLNYFIRNEDNLVASIRQRRAELKAQFRAQVSDFAAGLS